ncbi:MAG: hypothetical protein ACM3MK_13865 [Chitinophagales bacterium]
MRNNYCYLIKNLPLEKCPPDLTEKIIQRSGAIPEHAPKKCRGWWFDAPTWSYGLACMTIIISMALGFAIHSDDRYKQQQRLAENTVSITKQISFNFKSAFLNERR